MSTYTEIPFERAEELWHLGVEVEWARSKGFIGWTAAFPKDAERTHFIDHRYSLPVDYRYRVQTE